MLQISQIFKNIDLEFAISIFILILLLLLVYQIIHFLFKDKITIYLRIPKLKKIFDVSTKIGLIIFSVIFFIWNILLVFPNVSELVYPADSMQRITLKNNSSDHKKYILIGRLAYKDLWKPLRFEINSMFDIEKIINPSVVDLKKDETLNLKVRAGLKDIVYLYICESKNDKFSNQEKGVLIQVPTNDLVLYPDSFSKKTFDKQNICLFDFYISIAFYFTGIISCIWLFSKYNNISKLKKIIILSFLSIVSLGFSYLIFLNIKTIIYFQ